MDATHFLPSFFSQCEVFGSVSVHAVLAAENKLQLSFPEEYKQFLYHSGALIGDGIEIYGLPIQNEKRPPLWQNDVTVTQQLRASNQIGIENNTFIPIANDGMDVNYFMDTNKSPDMSIWAISYDTKHLIASNLSEFIEKIYSNHAEQA